jgi:hypothetical protein
MTMDNKLENWATFAIVESHNFSTVGTVYEEPNGEHFRNYVKYLKKNPKIEEFPEVPEIYIPLNPPPAPKITDDSDPEFTKRFEDATHYIFYAAAACQRLRVDDEVSRRSKLRWYSVLADLYDKYKKVVSTMPDLTDNGDVARAMEIAEGAKRDKKKETLLQRR